MSIDVLKNALPEYARDIKLNLSALAVDESLTSQQLWGCFLASALACGQADVITQMAVEARTRLGPEAFTAAQAAASVMAMNNIYYRFVHLARNESYRTLPAKLRMNIIANPGVDKTDFELWSLVVSAVNGCGMCVDSHEQQLLKSGLSIESIQTAVRVAAVTHAVAATLNAEAALQKGLNVSAAA